LTTTPNYRYSEGESLKRLVDYVNATYNQHYADGKGGQLFDGLEDEESFTFSKVSAQKYLRRFGKKDGYNEKDLLKTLHYVILMLHFYKSLPDAQPKTAEPEKSNGIPNKHITLEELQKWIPKEPAQSPRPGILPNWPVSQPGYISAPEPSILYGTPYCANTTVTCSSGIVNAGSRMLLTEEGYTVAPAYLHNGE
jgi:hypothetical protein